MSRNTLVAAIGDEFQSKAEAERAVDAVMRGIAKVVNGGGAVTIQHFGTFKTKTFAERMGRNPRTGESIRIGARSEIGFKPVKNA